jgi:hypothetical protein
MAGHQRTADTPAGEGRADTPAGEEQVGAILRIGTHAHAMGEGRMRREPQRGGREDLSTGSRNHAHRNRLQKQYHTQNIWALELRVYAPWI